MTNMVSDKIASISFLIRVLISVIINMIKSLVFTLLTIFCITLNAQIKIDVVGDNWEHNVHKVLINFYQEDLEMCL